MNAEKMRNETPMRVKTGRYSVLDIGSKDNREGTTWDNKRVR